MALGTSNYGQGRDAWEPQNDDLKDGSHEGSIFEFRCWEAKDGKDYVSWGIQVGDLKVERFHCLTTKDGKSLGWVLERDLRAVLGAAPPLAEVQTEDGRTGPIRHKLVGKKIKVFHGERRGYHDVYIDGAADATDGDSW